MGTFLLSSYGTNGDVLPFVAIGGELRRRGHEVVLHTHEYYGATARAAGLDFVPVDTEESYARTLYDAKHLLMNVLADINHLADYHERNGLWEQIGLEYASMAALARERDPAQVVAASRHTSGLSVLMLRESHGVPAAWVALSPTLFMSVALTERVYPRTLGAPVNRIRAAAGLSPVEDWPAWLGSADLQLGLWPEWFDAAGEPSPPGTALPGFVLHDEAESGALPAEVEALVADGVPDGRRPVLLTGGSGQLLHREWYRVAAEACARAGRPGILVCRHRDMVPEELPDGVIWQPALPFRTLIPRVAAVLHHGGVLTCARSIVSGVPQVILAHATDRPDNAARMRRLGLAEWLPAARWTVDAAADLLTRVLGDPGYAARNRERAPLVDSTAAIQAACDRLERLMGTRATAVPLRSSREVPVRDRIQRLSPEQRAALLKRLRPAPRPPRTEGVEEFACSYHQRRAWLAAQVDAGGGSAHVATAIRLAGPLDLAALTAAVDEVVARHDGLRTVPVPGAEEPRQRVVGGLRAPLRVDSSNDVPRWVERVRSDPFDLDGGPLVRMALLRTGPEEQVFALVGHHFVMDAASLGIVAGEVAAAYSARVEGRGPAFDGPPVQYPDVAAHQRRRLAGGGLEKALEHWRSTLDGAPAPAALPLPPGREPGEAVRTLAPDLAERLLAAAGGLGRMSLAPVLLAAYQLLLGRYTGGEDVPVGVHVGGRTEPGTERVVGDFTNIVAVRAVLPGTEPFPAAVRRVGEAFGAAVAHQDAPFEAVVAALAPPREPGRPALVGYGFSMQHHRLDEITWSGLAAEVLPTAGGHSHVDLTLVAVPKASGEVKLVFEYPAGRFDAAAVEELAGRYHDLLGRLAAASDRPVAEALAAGVPEPAPLAPAEAPSPEVEYVPPRTEGEELVAAVVAEVLQLEKVGVLQNFFGMGGHSLHAMRVIARINAATGLDVPLRLLFAHPTVAELTEALEELAE